MRKHAAAAQAEHAAAAQAHAQAPHAAEERSSGALERRAESFQAMELFERHLAAELSVLRHSLRL